MKGYCLFDNLEVRDIRRLESYHRRVRQGLKKFGGRHIIFGGQFRSLEGNPRPKFLVLIEFPSYEKALQWYYSDEHQEIQALRLRSAVSDCTIIEGI